MTNKTSTTIAVVGATGQQGGAAARALLAAGHRVRGLTRSTSSPAAVALTEAGIKMVHADLNDPTTVRAALDAVDGVFAVTTPTEQDGPAGETRHGITIAEAAAAAGVRHLVYSSVGGAERNTGVPHFDSKYAVETHLAGLDLASTVLRPVFFMENLLATHADGGRITVALPLPADVPMQMISTDDIGHLAAAVMFNPDWYGRALEIAGDELTGPQMADTFSAVSGLPADYQALPLSVMAGNPDLHRMFEWFTEPVAYTADFVTTRALDPTVQTLKSWLTARGWRP